MSRRSWVVRASVLGVVALLAVACGSSDRDADGGTATTTTSADGGSGAPVRFGDLPSPCGKGTGSGATDQGVTDDAIRIGYGDDAGFAGSPGLSHEVSDAVRGFVAWCNDQGGINGRPVEATYYDAKVTDVKNAVVAACQREFFLVGEGWSFDSGQEETRVGCGLPAVPAFAVSPAFAHGPKAVQAVPNPVDLTPVQNLVAVKKAFPAKIAKTAVMFGNYASTVDTKDKFLAAAEQVGYGILPCPQEYNILGESDWKPFVQKLKGCGAEVVYFTGSPFPFFVNYLEAASQLDYRPIYLVDANFYDANLAKWNTHGLADGTYVRESYMPLEEADLVPAVQQYIDIVRASKGDTAQLGEQAASAFLLWATATDACGSKLTRACVLREIAGIHDWTAGGLHSTTDPASNEPPACGVTLKLEGTRFVRFAPKKKGTLDCDPSYVAPVTGRLVDGAKLDAHRVSTLFAAEPVGG